MPSATGSVQRSEYKRTTSPKRTRRAAVLAATLLIGHIPLDKLIQRLDQGIHPPPEVAAGPLPRVPRAGEALGRRGCAARGRTLHVERYRETVLLDGDFLERRYLRKARFVLERPVCLHDALLVLLA